MRIIVLVGCLLLSSFTSAFAADNLSGTYRVKAKKGDIVLTLQADDKAEGTYKGTFKGGTASWVIKAFAVKDDDNKLSGTIRDAASGQFLSFCQVVKQPDRLIVFLVPAKQGGEPDYSKKMPVVFPLTGAKPAPAEPAGGDAATNDTAAPDAPDAAPDAPEATAPTGDLFSGVFKSAIMTLNSHRDGDGYAGSINFAGDIFQFTAHATGNQLDGEFSSKDGKFPFSAVLNGTELKLNSEGAAYSLAKQGGKHANPLARKKANPLAKKHHPENPAPAAPAAEDGAVPDASHASSTVPASWKIYKHPLGLTIRYPPNWKLKEITGFLQMIPPNLSTDAQGQPTELYLVGRVPSGGITDVNDPQLVSRVSALISQIFPFLQPAGEPQKVNGGKAPGLMAAFAGTNQKGMDVQAHDYLTIIDAQVLSVLSVGVKEKVAAREKIVRTMFTSISTAPVQRDARLVGTWQSSVADNGQLIRDGGNQVSTTTASDSSDRYTFAADGTVVKKSYSRTIVNAPGVSLDTGDDVETTRGSWVGGGGKLLITWENGKTAQLPYQIRAEPGSRRLLSLGSYGYREVGAAPPAE